MVEWKYIQSVSEISKLREKNIHLKILNKTSTDFRRTPNTLRSRELWWISQHALGTSGEFSLQALQKRWTSAELHKKIGTEERTWEMRERNESLSTGSSRGSISEFIHGVLVFHLPPVGWIAQPYSRKSLHWWAWSEGILSAGNAEDKKMENKTSEDSQWFVLCG